MLVEFGNVTAVDQQQNPIGLDAPTVTYFSIPDVYTFDPALNHRDAAIHLAQNTVTTMLPDNEAFVGIAHAQGGAWRSHSSERPSWVWSDNKQFQEFLCAYYSVPNRPDDVEDTHYTRFGPPGVGAWAINGEMNITYNGRDIWARALGGGQIGAAGTTTTVTPTSLTDSTASWTPHKWVGVRVVNGRVWGNVVDNTSTTLTIDQWYHPEAPGSGPATQPANGLAYVIMDGAAPAWFMGLSTNSTTLSNPSSNYYLPQELNNSGGGLNRKICIFAHTASLSIYTLTAVFTAGVPDGLPVSVGSIGIFNSAVVSDTTQSMLLNSTLSSPISLPSLGSQLTVTDSISGS